MFIELVDSLRCPRPHEDAWLVLGADRMDGRNVMDGVLGCPVCDARFPIANGIADLRTGAAAPVPDASSPVAPDAEQAMRLAAFLNLGDARGFAVLAGSWTAQAAGVQAITDMHLLLVNPAPGVAIGNGTSGILADERLPLAPGSAYGVALDRSASAALLVHAVQGVRPGGRMVAPADLPLPPGATELARDAVLWVAERAAAPGPLVSLSRGGR
ncbi:MAG TPA: hypothetical protein VMV51_02255 [Gemmatimonadaceae bacterium]|nr:hypothetical protein [Gemmatimonadaceae bacterium]